MPIIKSAIERVKTNNKANVRNTAQMSAMRTAVKKFEAAKTAGADNVGKNESKKTLLQTNQRLYAELTT